MGTRALVLLGLLAPSTGWACGQSAHVWVLLHALEHVQPGPVADLVLREDLRDHLLNGAMFPDGGYSPLTQHGYGETAHWPPFQTTYLDWIAEQPEGLAREQHLALDLGMAAHGLADQIFDGVFLTWSQELDADGWVEGNVDLVTDIVLVGREGPMPVPPDVLPYEDLAEVMNRHGVDVPVSTLQTGQASLRAALSYVAGTASDVDRLAEYEAQFPWANAHLLDATTPGSPACIGEVVVRHWETMLERLDGTFDADDRWVIATWPADGAYGHPTDALDPFSRVSLTFARAIDRTTLAPGGVVVKGPEGRHPVEFSMYYGDGSNVLNLWPMESWAEDTTYTVTVRPGVSSFDGMDTLSTPWTFQFSTGEPPEEEVAACGCAAAPGSAGWLVLLITAGARRARRPSGSAPS